MSRCFPSFLLAIFLFAPPSANAREWSDVTGKYKTEAELVAFNHEKVVLKRADKDLLSLPLDKLSQADRDYLETLSKDEAKNTPEPQTWTMRDGTKVVGRIVGYARRDVTIQRRRRPDLCERPRVRQSAGDLSQDGAEDRGGIRKSED